MIFDHVALKSTDINRSIDWYKENLKDVAVLYQDESWGLINVCNVNIAFVVPSQHPPHICFEINNESNIEIIKNKVFKKHRDGTSSCYLSDPDGNHIEFLNREK